MTHAPRRRLLRYEHSYLFLFFGISLIAVVAAESPYWQVGSFALFAAALIFAGLGIVCSSCASAGMRRLSLILFTFSLVCSLAGLIPWKSEAGSLFWGMSPDKISCVRGIVLGDSRHKAHGQNNCSIALSSAGDKYGNRVLARGNIIFFYSGSERLYRGMTVGAAVRLAGRGTGGNAEQPALAFVRGDPEILKQSPPLLQARAEIFTFLKYRIRSIGRSAPALLEALLLGFKEGESERLYDLFRRAGGAHMLALSGMHLGILSLTVVLLLSPLLGRARGILISLLGVWAYLFLVGPGPSLVRAAIMYSLGSVAYLIFRKKPDIMHVLSISLFLQIFLDPASTASLGFQLSYLALGAIILFSPAVYNLLPALIPPALRALLSAGSAAQLGTAFLLIKNFGQLYPAGLLSALLLSPLIALWMCAGLIYLGLSFLMIRGGPILLILDTFLKRGLELAARATIDLVEMLSALPPLRISPSFWPWAALAGFLLLTLITVCQYAGSYGSDRKLQLPQSDPGLPGAEWDGGKPPVWAEFPDRPIHEGENHSSSRAA